MAQPTQATIDGANGNVAVHQWAAEEPKFILLLAHGYGEHARRYDHVADYLVDAGAAVYAPDHQGHGKSDGEPAVINSFGDVVSDLHQVQDLANAEHPGLKTVLLGHSMGGLIASAYAQQYGDELAGLILSGPAVGENPAFALLGMDPIPEVPIDPAILSRDPAVGEAYMNDDLVYHGPFLRPTLEAFKAQADAISAGPKFSMPLLYVHGEGDALVPLEVAQPVVQSKAPEDFEEHVYPGAMHEVLNETNKDEVLSAIGAFLQRTV